MPLALFALLFGLLFGLSMDYEMFILTRIDRVYESTGDTGQAVIRSILAPALVTLLGHFNWWLPAPIARLLRVTPQAGPPASPRAEKALTLP